MRLTGARVPALDGLRGFAVLLVVLMHLRIPALMYGGVVGVTVFFVLSGFLITGLLLEEHARDGKVRLGAFWMRRARRLLPALVLLLAVIGAGYAWAGVDFWPKARAALFYYGNFKMAEGVDLTPIAHTWSLAVEEQFYLVWPLLLIGLLAVAKTRVVATLMLVAAVASALWRIVVFADQGHQAAYFSTATNMFGLLLGAALAMAVAAGAVRPARRHLAAVGLLGLVLLATQPFAARVRFGWREDLVAIPAAVLAAVVIAASLRGFAALEWRPLVILGQVSYGVYLWHGAIFGLLDSDPLLRTVVGIPATALMVWISWRFVEQPLVRPRLGDARDRERRSVDRLAHIAGDGVVLLGREFDVVTRGHADAPSQRRAGEGATRHA